SGLSDNLYALLPCGTAKDYFDISLWYCQILGEQGANLVIGLASFRRCSDLDLKIAVRHNLLHLQRVRARDYLHVEYKATFPEELAAHFLFFRAD
ncbi:MAG TPA: hypothetical protein VH601_18855, partial [Bryobacteraceae bacterium]